MIKFLWTSVTIPQWNLAFKYFNLELVKLFSGLIESSLFHYFEDSGWEDKEKIGRCIQ